MGWVGDLRPSHHSLCEHSDCDPRVRLTFATETGPRYCADHFPWESETERTEAAAAVDDTTPEFWQHHNPQGVTR